jgi:hypothetical protein
MIARCRKVMQVAAMTAAERKQLSSAQSIIAGWGATDLALMAADVLAARITSATGVPIAQAQSLVIAAKRQRGVA